MKDLKSNGLLFGLLIGIFFIIIIFSAYKIGYDNGYKKAEDRLSIETTETIEFNKQHVYFKVSENCERVEDVQKMDNDENARFYCLTYEDGKTAFEYLSKLKEESSFDFKYNEFEFGVMISEVNGLAPVEGSEFWSMLVNDQMSMEGVSTLKLNLDDVLLLKIEKII